MARPSGREPAALLAGGLALLVLSGIGPHDRLTWLLEVGPILLGLPLLVATYRRFPLTPLCYRLLFLHACVLMLGGHYTYAEVPLGFWARDALGLARNHYDRVGHLAQGFVPAILAREVLLRCTPLRAGRWLFFLVTCVCLAVSALYELVEWWAAVTLEAGATAFLGTQGDPWDTQWDMFLALVGAVAAQLLLARRQDRELASLDSTGRWARRRPMRFGLQLMNLEFPRLRDVAQMAEGLGFHVLYLPDHIVYEGPERQYDPHHLSYDVMVQAAVVAQATRRVRVGHLVLCNLFRHPVITAQSLVTLDHVSDGRAVAGLGTGWTETEFRMTGIPYPEIGTRLRMLDEALTVIRGLWTQETTTFEGEFYRLREAILWPKPRQAPHPPIVLGGSGRGLLRLAARHADVVNIISEVGRGGYISMANVAKLDPASFQGKVRFLREEAARHGRDPKAIEVSDVCFTAMVTDSPAATRAMATNMGAMFGAPPEAMLQAPLNLIGTPEECVTELRRRAREWEVEEFVFPFAGEDALKRLAQEVLAHV